ncbi:hypothetical protein CAPTEDRAFT_210878 [Capitella teleta]|uniref:Coiled-coil domain-containing protein 60 n=1 Tax=Capitella teleta TaxID=283909 RepID=R7TY68_CAPTE|nr:hypothetical protein CAPTEDRAFT_210878 [Capitella teleta]|eukprot:ELT98833.1 hypothetical protein CAPTEDRAFT_210878 [Capitella teleta]
MRVTLQKEVTPEKFVQPVPLPIPSHKGLSIQARSDVVYNANVPTRDVVRKENYNRRQMQLSAQGFHAVNFRPYQGIGDPFYLSEKRLILHALGQWDENLEDDSSSSSDSSSDEEQQNHQAKAVTPANFVLRRARKDLNTLPKEVSHGRDMIRNVRLGHGLFQILRKDRQMKSEAKQQEIIRKRELMRSEWQPPKDSSSEDESDEEFQDVEMNSYGGDLTSERLDLHVRTMVEGEDGEETQDEENISSTSAVNADQITSESRNVGFTKSTAVCEKSPRSIRSSRKRQQNARPYTPSHSNIGADENVWPDKYVRECSVPTTLLPPLASGSDECGVSGCHGANHNVLELQGRWWNKNNIIQSNEGSDGIPLENLLNRSQTQVGRGAGENEGFDASSATDWSRPRQTHAPCIHPKHAQTLKRADMESVEELQAALHQLHSSISSLRTKIVQEQQPILEFHYAFQNQPDSGGSISSIAERKRSMFFKRKSSARLVSIVYRQTSYSEYEAKKDVCKCAQFADTFLVDDLPTSRIQNSVHDDRMSVMAEVGSNKSEMSVKPTAHESSSKKRTEATALSRRPTATSRQEKEIQQRPQSPKMTKAQILEAIARHEEDPRLAKLIYIQEKRTSNKMRAEANVRPKSSAELVEHVANLPSTKVTQMPRMMRQKFAEVGQEKALVLHDILEAVERERMRKMQRKFTHMSSSRSVHRALNQMRAISASHDEDKRMMKQRVSHIYQQWYLDIDHAIPDEIKQDWYFTKIMSKLGKYGLVEASKQSAFKFLKVLTGLRDWEICSPDITAAIEFCRTKIVEMSVDEYEDFFMQQFPMVVRPNTAPPASKHSKGSGRGSEKAKDIVPRSRVVIKSQSAPVGSRTPHA